MPSVEILLATYNGEKYLPQLLDSLKKQTYKDCAILSRDDGSSDKTREILARDTYMIESKERLGVVGNFNVLLRTSAAPYVFFCDQDDVWHPNKIALTVKTLQKVTTPHLVFTDLTVADADAKPIHPSFLRFSSLNPAHTSLNRLIVQNIMTGCTMAINRPLVQLVGPIPSDAVMHDGWLAMAAACFGTITFIPQATLLYRQHGGNVLGARGLDWKKIFQPGLAQARRVQAETFLKQYRSRLMPSQIDLLEAYITLPTSSYLKQRWIMWKCGLFKSGYLRNLAHLLKPA